MLGPSILGILGGATELNSGSLNPQPSVAASLTLLSPRDWDLVLFQDAGVKSAEGELAEAAQAWKSNHWEVEEGRSDGQVQLQFHRLSSARTRADLVSINQPTN